MERIAVAIEDSIKYWKRFKRREYDMTDKSYEFNMNYAVATTAMNIDAKAIVAYTKTGDTPKMVSSFGVECPIFAITQDESTYRQLGLCVGIIPKLFEPQPSIDELLSKGVDKLIEEKFLVKKDKVVVAGGKEILEKYLDNKMSTNAVIGGILEI